MKIIFSMKHHHENWLCTSELTACYSLLQASVFRKGVGWSSDVEVMPFIVMPFLRSSCRSPCTCCIRDVFIETLESVLLFVGVSSGTSLKFTRSMNQALPLGNSLVLHLSHVTISALSASAYLSIMEIPHAKTSPQTEHVSALYGAHLSHGGFIVKLRGTIEFGVAYLSIQGLKSHPPNDRVDVHYTTQCA